MLKNGSFTEGWTNLPPTPGFLINQQPNFWQLRWIEPGQSLFGAGDTAGGIPECVHKLSDQLPPDEQLGGSNALILVGDVTYKIFHSGSPFGAELKQTITGLAPGTPATLTAPVLVVLNNETDPFGAESGVWVNGEGGWVNGGVMGNRSWFFHTVQFTVPNDGKAEIMIRVKSKWPRAKDFFIDGITLAATAVPDDDAIFPIDNHPTTSDKVVVQIPAGLQLVQTTCHTPGVVVVSVPEGVEIEIV